MNDLINEHDMTKKMMNVMRESRLVLSESSDEISPSPNDSVYREEVKKIMDTVDPRVQITKFKIYPKDREVQFNGKLDSGVNFFMSLKAMKLSISITDDNQMGIRIYLDAELIETFRKLSGYYENWVREWAQKLVTDFKGNN
jgi:hypothetical protein